MGEFTQKYGGSYTPYKASYNYPKQSVDRQLRSSRKAVLAQAQPKQRQERAKGQVKESKVNGNGNVCREVGKESGVEEEAKCYVCGKTGNVMRCSQCKSAFYCSREHQVSDWARHSKECASLAAKADENEKKNES